ncbi:hypothetical protein CH063_16098 [Colletotrichum higginsianum]|uniref:Uncharacterized protein n=1 Tax=Colletotrichum higginsianum (strain IMI 349063) TaxID=759273 RepID=H1UUV4_COLHI|nr:hypothetical protein CH063_16098 [Colletotrichum higginsianum]
MGVSPSLGARQIPSHWAHVALGMTLTYEHTVFVLCILCYDCHGNLCTNVFLCPAWLRQKWSHPVHYRLAQVSTEEPARLHLVSLYEAEVNDPKRGAAVALRVLTRADPTQRASLENGASARGPWSFSQPQVKTYYGYTATTSCRPPSPRLGVPGSCHLGRFLACVPVSSRSPCAWNP